MRADFRQDGFSLIELLVVVAVIAIGAAMAVPFTQTTLRAQGFQGDARAVKSTIELAKMRASSNFTRARVRADLGANTYVLQIWDKAASAWVNEGAVNRMTDGVEFGFGTLATPPPNTQVAIAQSPACTPTLTDENPIDDTACITFNSRGLPVDANGVIFTAHALYLSGETGISGTTITATPLIRLWWSPRSAAAWRAE